MFMSPEVRQAIRLLVYRWRALADQLLLDAAYIITRPVTVDDPDNDPNDETHLPRWYIPDLGNGPSDVPDAFERLAMAMSQRRIDAGLPISPINKDNWDRAATWCREATVFRRCAEELLELETKELPERRPTEEECPQCGAWNEPYVYLAGTKPPSGPWPCFHCGNRSWPDARPRMVTVLPIPSERLKSDPAEADNEPQNAPNNLTSSDLALIRVMMMLLIRGRPEGMGPHSPELQQKLQALLGPLNRKLKEVPIPPEWFDGLSRGAEKSDTPTP